MVMITSLRAATSRGEKASAAPAATSVATAWRFRSCTTNG